MGIPAPTTSRNRKGPHMYTRKIKTAVCLAAVTLFAASAAFAQMGRTWPSEKKIVPDPVTGLPLTFLTSTDGGYSQSKIYQTRIGSGPSMASGSFSGECARQARRPLR